jgi:hypothetical protein
MNSVHRAIDLVHIDNINGVVTATATCGSNVVFIVRFIELAHKFW